MLAFAASARAVDPPELRRIESRHLTLVTDLAADDQVDKLPEIFDQAFAGWCQYFRIDPAKHADWKVTGRLMRDRGRFVAAGLLPDGLPPFENGYCFNNDIWLMDQTSEYYRRHLLLHEGTHAFMLTILGGTGTPWYTEGMAELLATHTLADGKLTLDAFPQARDEVSKWGRIEIVQRAFAERRALNLPKIFAYTAGAHGENEPYGWCWATAALLDGHPRYRERFRQVPVLVQADDFNAKVEMKFADDWARLNEDWQLFVAMIDYGYDFARTDFDATPGKPLAASATASVTADRGWQNTGIRLEAGERVRLRANGRYHVADGLRTLPCEPGGVTIRYHQGQPLGLLLAAFRADEVPVGATSGLVKPLVVGLGGTLTAKQPGTLFLRFNIPPGGLAGSWGSAAVQVSHVQ